MSVNVNFLGAAGTVTGSKFLFTSSHSSVLVDCGMFQGIKDLRLKNWEKFPVQPASIDAVIITHAHLDHCGYLPRLVKSGFTGTIYMTPWTRDLVQVILLDSAKLQMEDAEYAEKKGYSKHKKPLPLYDTDDVLRTLQLIKEVKFSTRTHITSDTYFTFHPAGHILGAAFVDLEMESKRILISGDLGRGNHPLLRDPESIPDANFDAVLIESTYGDESHTEPDGSFERVINQTIKRGGSVLIPAFAVDRTEIILMELKRLVEQQVIPSVPIFVDSPMALQALEFYRGALREKSWEINPRLQGSAEDIFSAGNLTQLQSVEESKSLNQQRHPCIIISASGMATGGRVVHHLARMLPDPKNSVILTGYQAVGTRGRSLLDGAKMLKMFGKDVEVNAQIELVDYFSVHADQSELLTWLDSARAKPTKVFAIHGDDETSETFAKVLREHGFNAYAPILDESIEI